MFEDSLVESTGRIRTRSRWYAIGSFALEAAVLAALILIPYLYPDALPKEAFSALLVAPPPPSAPAQLPRAPAVRSLRPVELPEITNLIIRRIIPEGDNGAPTPPNMDIGSVGEGKGDVRGALPLLGSAPPPLHVAPAPKPAGPVRISEGVVEGHILVPIQPVYPAIAKAAHIQGTVTIEAVISKEGLIEQARIVSGPPMLVQAALAALNHARYAPFKLNGEPVEVETTISINFVLGD